MATTYFGLGVDSDGELTLASTVSSNAGYNLWMSSGATCPGSGSQTVVSLGCYAYTTTTGTKYIRLGIYDSDGNLVAEGSSRKVIGNGSGNQGWIEWSAAELSVNPLTLTGGSAYRIFIDQYDSNFSTTAGSTTNGTSYNSTSYVSGLPATLPSSAGAWRTFPLRIGLGGTTLTVAAMLSMDQFGGGTICAQ